jgi:hypothetical protein
MMTVSPASNPMKLYRAVYRETDQTERKLDLYAQSLAKATLSAAELVGPQGTLVRVYENPDW